MKIPNLNHLLLGASLLAGSGVALHAQSYSVGWSVVAGGGGTSTNGQYNLAGTIGQYDIGSPMSGGNFSVNGGFWQVPGGPALTIKLTSPTTVLVSWSAAALGCFMLQATSSLSNPVWVDVPNAVTFNNGVSSVVLPATSLAQFYRLVSPCQ